MENKENILPTLEQTKLLYGMLHENIERLYISLSLIIFYKEENIEAPCLNHAFINIVRKNDHLFKIDERTWAILCINSSEREALAVIERMNKEEGLQSIKSFFRCAVAEIRDKHASIYSIIEASREALADVKNKAQKVVIVKDFSAIPLTKVKISVIEADEYLSKTLLYSLNNLKVENFELEVKHFNDGAEFLSSDFYHSSHKHLIIFNDVLPRQNGIEVLYNLRQLPNLKKFYTFMISERNFEQFAANGFQNGLDYYLTKPIPHHLFLSLISRTLNRLWD